MRQQNSSRDVRSAEANPGIARKIVGFHQDEQREWVADLECGHSVHVRHNPPWINRAWVSTPEGRAAKLGESLNCTLCDSPDTPD